MNIILVSWEFFARVNLHHSYLTISILPRSIIVNVPTHLEIRALKEFREIKPSLQELQQKVEVNIIFLFPHLGSWKLAVKGVLRSDRLIVQYSVNCASARLGDLTFSQVKFYKIAAYSVTLLCYSTTTRTCTECVWRAFLEVSWLVWKLHWREDVGGGASTGQTFFSDE